jgi:heme/copper-type cytochrome/quinol oxidase subunit 4
MGVNLATFQIVLIVTIIVGVIMIIYSAWVMTQLNSTVGDECLCSGVSTQQVNSLYIFSVITLLIGIALVIHGVIFLFLQGAGDRRMREAKEQREAAVATRRSRIAERVTSEYTPEE